MRKLAEAVLALSLSVVVVIAYRIRGDMGSPTIADVSEDIRRISLRRAGT